MPREIALDVRGRPCPVPVLELARAIRDAESGDVVVLRADDAAAWDDVRAWCDSTGHRLVQRTRQGTELRAWVEKSPAEP